MILFPAIDIIDGKCVRLVEGDFSQRTDYGLIPADAAQGFESEGAAWIHLVDLDGAKAGAPKNLEAISEVRRKVKAKIQVGGGIRGIQAARDLLALGVDRVIVGTAVTQDLGLAREFFSEFGDKVAAGLDLKNGRPATHGWLETSSIEGLDLATTLVEAGCKRVIVTDIATDGKLQGPNLDLMIQFSSNLPIPVIASGGVAVLADLDALKTTSVEGVIVGKAIYEGRFTVAEGLRRCSPEAYASAPTA